MNCFECKQPIRSSKELIKLAKNRPFSFVAALEFSPFPSGEQDFFNCYHKICAPDSPIAKQIKVQHKENNPFVDCVLSMATQNNWTWKETLEYLVISLIEENSKQRDIIFELELKLNIQRDAAKLISDSVN